MNHGVTKLNACVSAEQFKSILLHHYATHSIRDRNLIYYCSRCIAGFTDECRKSRSYGKRRMTRNGIDTLLVSVHLLCISWWFPYAARDRFRDHMEIWAKARQRHSTQSSSFITATSIACSGEKPIMWLSNIHRYCGFDTDGWAWKKLLNW